MVRESQYQKALSMCGIGTVIGFVAFLSGFSQMATLPDPNWFLVIYGFIIALVFALAFGFTLRYGKKYFSTVAYIGDTRMEYHERKLLNVPAERARKKREAAKKAKEAKKRKKS